MQSVYGDRGSNTLGNIAARMPLRIPALRELGLDRLASGLRLSASDSRRRSARRSAEWPRPRPARTR